MQAVRAGRNLPARLLRLTMLEPSKKIMKEFLVELDVVLAEMKVYDDNYKLIKEQRKKEREKWISETSKN